MLQGTRVTVGGQSGAVILHSAPPVRAGFRIAVLLDNGQIVLPLAEDVSEEGS